LLSGPLLALAAALVGQLDGLDAPAWQVAGLTAWLAIWWVSEAVPVAATSLLPVLFFPLLGLVPVREVMAAYMHPFVMLLLAGFMAALAIERWNLHRRVAFRILLAVGTSPSRLILGVMVATAVCSMWISNTASTLIMLPIALALVAKVRESGQASEEEVQRFGLVLLLALCYSASVGGLGTPVGSPPNLIFMAHHGNISFLDWLSFGIPTVVILIPVIWFYLTRFFGKLPKHLSVGGRDILQTELRGLGPMSAEEKSVAFVFLLMAGLWVTREIIVSVDPQTGAKEVVGWASLLGLSKVYAHDAMVAVLGALLLFAWPSKNKPGERLLDWATAKQIPWDVLLLFGGGIALAGAFKASGLSSHIVSGLTGLSTLPPLLLILSIALTVTFLTEVTSNTATANVMMPLLAGFASSTGLSQADVMIPAVLAVSCAFMLPVATAPNAIVYGSGLVPIKQMMRAGLGLNIIAALIISLLSWLVF
jgi:sodium-dependent dicarboxylate transporter 2/3/5